MLKNLLVNSKIHPLTLNFKNHKIQKEYEEHYFKSKKNTIKFVVISLALV